MKSLSLWDRCSPEKLSGNIYLYLPSSHITSKYWLVYFFPALEFVIKKKSCKLLGERVNDLRMILYKTLYYRPWNPNIFQTGNNPRASG